MARTQKRYRVRRDLGALIARDHLRPTAPSASRHSSRDWFLSPWHRHGWGLSMVIAARVQGTIPEPRNKPRQLFHRLLVGSFALFSAGQFGLAEHARFGIAAGQGDECGRTGREQTDPVGGAF